MNRRFLHLRNYILLSVVIITACISLPVYAKSGVNNAAMLLRQTPLQGGSINMGVGLHSIEVDSQVNLTAIPKPGYQFVYWLGDVLDPVSNSTIAIIDTPKIIIAVYERIAHEFIIPSDYLVSSPGGTSVYASVSTIGNTLTNRSSLRRKVEPRIRIPEKEHTPFILVPGDDFEPVPEPTTIVLFGLGSLLLRNRRKRNLI